MKKALILIGAFLSLTSCNSTSIYSFKNSDSFVSFDFYSFQDSSKVKEGEKKTIVIDTIYDGENNKNSSETKEVYIGQDLSNTLFFYSSNMNEYYCYGVFEGDSNNLLKASAIKSFDGSFEKITIKYCKKSAKTDILKAYEGIYHNYCGYRLEINNDTVAWEYSFDQKNKVVFEARDVYNDGSVFSPLASTLLINGKKVEIKNAFSIEMANYDLYKETNGSVSFCFSLLRNAFVPFGIEKCVEEYCLKNDKKFDTSAGVLQTEFCYVKSNDLTINYNL